MRHSILSFRNIPWIPVCDRWSHFNCQQPPRRSWIRRTGLGLSCTCVTQQRISFFRKCHRGSKVRWDNSPSRLQIQLKNHNPFQFLSCQRTLCTQSELRFAANSKSWETWPLVRFSFALLSGSGLTYNPQDAINSKHALSENPEKWTAIKKRIRPFHETSFFWKYRLACHLSFGSIFLMLIDYNNKSTRHFGYLEIIYSSKNLPGR